MIIFEVLEIAIIKMSFIGHRSWEAIYFEDMEILG